MSLNLYDTRQLALLNPTDLRTHGKALLAANQNIGGTGSEKEAIVRAWTEFATVLFPEVASELVAMDCNGILSSSGHPFNQDEENSKFQSKIYWNTCMATMPKESTFRAEINSLISTMQWHHTNLKRNKSLYGECYLVGWMLHHMSEPVSNFLKWSLERKNSRSWNGRSWQPRNIYTSGPRYSKAPWLTTISRNAGGRGAETRG